MENFDVIEEEIEFEQDSKMETYFTDSAYKDFVNKIRSYPVLSSEENKNLALKAQEGDQRARDKVINCNLRLVVWTAYRYADKIKHLQAQDIIQEGCLGLMTAVDKFDPERGAFSNCAVIWIRQAIERTIKNKEKEIRLPISFDIKRVAYIKLLNEYERAGLTLPSDDEICKMLKISLETLFNIKNTNIAVTSINSEINPDESETELENLIISEDNSYDQIINKIDDQVIFIILKEILSPKQYYVIYNRYLIDDQKSLEEVAIPLNLTRERVRQIEEKALKKAKPYMDPAGVLGKKLVDELLEKGVNFENYNITPINPGNIVKYLYLEKDLNGAEKLYLYHFLMGSLKPDSKEFINKFGVMPLNLQESLNNLQLNLQAFRDFKKDLYRRTKSDFYDRFLNQIQADNKITMNTYNKHVSVLPAKIDYDLLNEAFANFTFEEITELCRKHRILLNDTSVRLFNKFFHAGYIETELVQPADVKKEIYLLNFGYRKESKKQISNKLWEPYCDNKDEFTDEQQLYIECFLFNKKPKKLFLEVYPSSSLKNYPNALINKLESICYGVFGLTEDIFTRDKWLLVKNNYREKLTREIVKLLDLFYGLNDEGISIEEISSRMNEDYDKIYEKITNAINYCHNLYNNRFNILKLDKSKYRDYVFNFYCDFTDETRTLLKMFLVENLDYEQISEKTKLEKDKVSNIIAGGIRKIDFYRYGILRIEKISSEDLAMFFLHNLSSFNEVEKNIIIMAKIKKYAPSDIAKTLEVDVELINNTITKFNKLYQKYLIKNEPLANNDIIYEINKHQLESVIDEQGKTVLSFYYGFRSKYNPKGKKLTDEEIQELLEISADQLEAIVATSFDNIKANKKGILKSELIYMRRDMVDKTLDDVHLPITDEERKIICYLLELKGYPCKSLAEVAELYQDTKTNIKRKYQIAILKIYKYLYKEIAGVLNYELDILPNLKYFSKYEAQILEDFYKYKLTYEQLAEKNHETLNIIVSTINRLQSTVIEINTNKTAKKFDFDFYRKNKGNKKLPFDSDLKIATQYFELFWGEIGEKRLTIPEIIEKLDITVSESTIQKQINDLMISYCRLKAGIKRVGEFSNEEVVLYYERNKENMSLHQLEVYNQHFKDSSLSGKISLEIIYDLLLEKYPEFFDLKTVTREEVVQLISKHNKLMNPDTRMYLMRTFGICERDFLSEKELNYIYKILAILHENIIKFEDKDMVLKRQVDNNN